MGKQILGERTGFADTNGNFDLRGIKTSISHFLVHGMKENLSYSGICKYPESVYFLMFFFWSINTLTNIDIFSFHIPTSLQLMNHNKTVKMEFGT